MEITFIEFVLVKFKKMSNKRFFLYLPLLIVFLSCSEKSASEHDFTLEISPIKKIYLKVEKNSDPSFIDIIEEKTGIINIIRNNLNLQGAGIHKVYNNGFLCMHKDFEGYYDNLHGLLDRRINILIYMNPDWKEEYGGHLCLYDESKKEITKKIFINDLHMMKYFQHF